MLTVCPKFDIRINYHYRDFAVVIRFTLLTLQYKIIIKRIIVLVFRKLNLYSIVTFRMTRKVCRQSNKVEEHYIVSLQQAKNTIYEYGKQNTSATFQA